MPEGNDTRVRGGLTRWVTTKAFYPVVIALAFTLSYALADRMGPLGSVLGLGIGFLIGWAGSKWVVPRWRGERAGTMESRGE